LFALLHRRRQPPVLAPVILYLWLALAINLVIDVIMGINIYHDDFIYSNNPWYNVHSVTRFICFSVFFINLPQSSFRLLKQLLIPVFGIFLLLNFGKWENFFNPLSLSGNLMTVESYLLLIYCMQYYLAELKSDRDKLFNDQVFWVATGLAIYVVVNFFVFLFYIPMRQTNDKLANDIWNVHNVAFIIFCIFITKAFYVPARNQYTI
jgi:hypothetical protein